MDRIFAKLLYLQEKNIPAMLVTIVDDQGSAPRGTGSQMLVTDQGRLLGTIGGGAVEKRSEELAMELLARGENLLRSFALRKGAQEDIGMVCGGDVTVWFQYIPGDSEAWRDLASKVLNQTAKGIPGFLCLLTDGSVPAVSSQSEAGAVCLPLPIGERVFLFGAGHCGQALAPLLGTLGFRVTVFDDRQEYANRQLFPQAEEIIVGDYNRIGDYISVSSQDYAVVMTSGHSFDLEVQDQLLRQEMAYVGVIGSKKKKAAVNQRLRERGVSQEMIDTVHSPIGISINAVTPEEIAVSIAAEMIQVRAAIRQGAGTFVKGCPMH